MQFPDRTNRRVFGVLPSIIFLFLFDVLIACGCASEQEVQTEDGGSSSDAAITGEAGIDKDAKTPTDSSDSSPDVEVVDGSTNRDGEVLDSGYPADSSVPPDSSAVPNVPITSDPGCGCLADSYWIEIIGDGDDQVFTSPLFDQLPSEDRPFGYCKSGEDDRVNVPWAIANIGYGIRDTAGIYACDSDVADRSCLAIDLGIDDGDPKYNRPSSGIYIDRLGVRWSLVGPPFTWVRRSGYESDAISGDYEVTGSSQNGEDVRVIELRGRFVVCAITFISF